MSDSRDSAALSHYATLLRSRDHAETCHKLLEQYVTTMGVALTTSASVSYLDFACKCGGKHDDALVHASALLCKKTTGSQVRKKRIRNFGPKSVCRLVSFGVPNVDQEFKASRLRSAPELEPGIVEATERAFQEWESFNERIESSIERTNIEDAPNVWMPNCSPSFDDWDELSRMLILGIIGTDLEREGALLVPYSLVEGMTSLSTLGGNPWFTSMAYMYGESIHIGLACRFRPPKEEETDKLPPWLISPLSSIQKSRSLMQVIDSAFMKSMFNVSWSECFRSISALGNNYGRKASQDWVIDVYVLTKFLDVANDLPFRQGDYFRLPIPKTGNEY